ncbi:NB-ARC domain-containing protein [Frankia sp. CiP3]|uniref:NB-ARC domain-containing protein n=1 Tax=Frankia sp. CiP3 TaxID=2880971 RepID=UPI001EF5D2C8|nr:NB-ARC domain-containing protein [Frankia sp. CiP3]
MAPAPVGPLVERSGLVRELLASLRAPGAESVHLITALEGAGGFGKTTLAAQVCPRPEVEQRFPGGTLWVTVGERTGGAELAALIVGLCAELADHTVATADPMLAGRRLGDLLDAREPTLLVVDDVWTVDQLAPFLLGGKICRRLVTTRNADVVPRDGISLPVDRMTVTESVQTLTIGVDGLSRASVKRLVAATGRWPVLLGLVNAALNDHIRDGADMEAAARWVCERLETEGPTAFDVEDARSRAKAVAASVTASTDLLSADERDRYLDLAIFPEDADVPTPVLSLLWNATDGLEARAVERLRARLIRLRLVIGGWAENSPALRLHDVLRSYLRHRLTRDELAVRHGMFVDTARHLLPAKALTGTTTAWWMLPEEATYLWQHLPYHLREARRISELATLACDLRWVEAKIRRAKTVIPTEANLDLVDTPLARQLAHVLGQSAHLLTPIDPPTGLGATLISRLDRLPGMERVVVCYQAEQRGPHLHPIWPLPDRPDPACLRVLTGHDNWVRACTFSPDGNLIASACIDGTVRTWDTRTGRTCAILSGHGGGAWSCTFSPDGRQIASTTGDGSIRIWDSVTGHLITAFSEHSGAVWSCAFSPDGKIIASAGSDSALQIWDSATGQPIVSLGGHSGAVWSCAFSPDGKMIASAGDDKTVRIWNNVDRQLIASLTGHSGTIRSCAFSPDGRLLASAGRDHIRVQAVPNGHTVFILDTTGSAWSCAFSPNGALIASTLDDGTVQVWNATDGRIRTTMNGHTGPVWGCAFSPDSRRLVSAGQDRTLQVWDLAADNVHTAPVGATGWTRSCAFSPDGTLIAGARDDGAVWIWHSTGKPYRIVDSAHTGKVWCCAFAPRGRYLVTVGGDGITRVWDVTDGTLHTTGLSHTGPAYGCAVSPDGTLIASVGDDGTVRLSAIFTTSRRTTLAGHVGAVWSCSFSPDSRLLASAGNDGTVRLWDVSTGQLRSSLTGHVGAVWNCTFSIDGQLLASAGNDGTVRLWDVARGRQKTTIHGGIGWFRNCTFSQDGQLLASVGDDGIIRIWELTGVCVCALRVAHPLSGCAWHPDSRMIVASGEGGIYLLAYTR